MKSKKFRVDVYDWFVGFVEVESKKDCKKIIHILKRFGVEKNVINEVRQNIKNGRENGGQHSYNRNIRESLILIYPCSSKKDRRGVIAHEKRHCEDVILQYFHIYDKEAASCLAGYLSEKLI